MKWISILRCKSLTSFLHIYWEVNFFVFWVFIMYQFRFPKTSSKLSKYSFDLSTWREKLFPQNEFIKLQESLNTNWNVCVQTVGVLVQDKPKSRNRLQLFYIVWWWKRNQEIELSDDPKKCEIFQIFKLSYHLRLNIFRNSLWPMPPTKSFVPFNPVLVFEVA